MKVHHNTLKKAAKFKIVLTVEDNEVVATNKDGVRLASGLQGNKVLEEAITRLTGHVAKAEQAPRAAKSAKAEKSAKAPKAKKAKKSAKQKACEAAGWMKTRGGFKQEGEEEPSSEAKNWDELFHELVEAGELDAADVRSGVKEKYKERYKPFKGRCGDDLADRISEHVSDGDGKTDKAALERFAKANDAWRPVYGTMMTNRGVWNAGMARMNVANILRGKVRRAQKDGETFDIKWV